MAADPHAASAKARKRPEATKAALARYPCRKSHRQTLTADLFACFTARVPQRVRLIQIYRKNFKILDQPSLKKYDRRARENSMPCYPCEDNSYDCTNCT